MTNIQQEEQYLLSTEQFKQFNEKGYLVIDGLITSDHIKHVFDDIKLKLDYLEQSLIKHQKITLNQNKTNATSTSTEQLDQRIIEMENQFKGASVILHSMFAGRLVKSIGDIMQHPSILDIVQQLLGDGNISGHPEWNVRVKVPNNRNFEVPWHQDAAYLAEGAEKYEQITVWIPLVDMNDCNGPIELILDKNPKLLPHKLQRIHSGGKEYKESWYLEIPENELQLDQNNRPNIISASDMKKGSILLFNNKIVHHSTANISTSVRWTIDIRFQKTQDPSGFHPIGSVESANEPKMKLRSDKERSIPINYEQWGGNRDILMTKEEKSNSKKEEEDDIFKYGTIEGPWMDRWK